MQVVVFGAGSLGSLIGGLLADEHDVTLVGREPHVGAVRERGLEITGEIETTTRPDAATTVPGSAELAIVTVKSYDTAEAARALWAADPDVVLSLQNGLGNEETLAGTLNGTVLAGTCTYGARLVEPGVVECTGVGTVTLGSRSGGRSDAAERTGSAFERGGIDTTVATDMPRRLWEKLAINAGINAITALARVENGALRDGPASEIAARAAREVARVARASGIDLADERAVSALEGVVETTAPNRSSMYQDLVAERRTEIDAINGAVIERASVPVPVNETLTGLVRAWERERNVR
ncbi:ketopantoate reductase family protein [Halapricum hydrolyticum]|uniref:2-dehydropantoate 2-reductase n=1 Tax=Halapricum hydrolyticum TaxID=2979991 RepID=A0AAE3I8M8_9EURY|nr:ketopantoate reductase family protein [Halapricum hydrolyticum]MCU4716652.1 ketopantoate reductase family protein [Halapricum hydrolyticum]MCU4725743.1 ketopantoate reductase family protein [Halapricum hydrolyticum]